MLPYLPLLVSANTFGVISLLILLASTIIFTIPVFATRGTAQIVWGLAVGFVLTVEAAVLVTLVVLTSQGKILQ